MRLLTPAAWVALHAQRYMSTNAEKLWRDSGAKPTDVQTAFRYDHFATIDNVSLGGTLLINTKGGLLGEVYIQGMNGITEGVRQVRGTSCNQVEDVEHVLVTSGTGVPTRALIPAPAD